MPSPFPGMDPYLESPGLWPDVHLEMISKIRSSLNPHVLPNYVVRIETRVFVSHEDDLGRRTFLPDLSIEKPNKIKGNKKVMVVAGVRIDKPLVIPYVSDPTIEEAYLEIKDRKTNSLVTVIEVLSPSNKIRGSEGRKSYMEKRQKFLASNVHLVDIDLLRAGDAPIVPLLNPVDYRVFLSRGGDRTRTRFWPIHLRDPLPVIGIPLKGDDPDVPLDLRQLLATVYESGAYDNVIDYSQPPDPPLNPADARWAGKLLREKGFR